MLETVLYVLLPSCSTTFTFDLVGDAALFLSKARYSLTDGPDPPPSPCHLQVFPVLSPAQRFPPHGTQICWLSQAKSDHTGLISPGEASICAKVMCICVCSQLHMIHLLLRLRYCVVPLSSIVFTLCLVNNSTSKTQSGGVVCARRVFQKQPNRPGCLSTTICSWSGQKGNTHKHSLTSVKTQRTSNLGALTDISVS